MYTYGGDSKWSIGWIILFIILLSSALGGILYKNPTSAVIFGLLTAYLVKNRGGLPFAS